MKKKKETTSKERYYVASQWQLMWRKFRKHKLALIGGTILIMLYIAAIFCEITAPYAISRRRVQYSLSPPQRIHFFDADGSFHLRPFVYGFTRTRSPKYRWIYKEDKNQEYPIYFFVHGDKYKLWNVLGMNVHLFGVKEPGVMFLFGTDKLARDVFSRTIYAARISLSIGVVGIGVSFLLGSLLGGISGYYGGRADMAIQRVIELLLSIPSIPLWMALSATLPLAWSSL